MFKEIDIPGKDTFGFEAIGEVTNQDYNDLLEPLLAKARAEGQKLRFLFFLGPNFQGFTAAAAWEDFKLGSRHLSSFDRIALVTDTQWLQSATRFVGSLLPCPLKVFENKSLNAAKAWLNSGEIGLDHHLDETRSVLKVEISGPLTSENFDILASRVDPWIETRGYLHGLVVRAKSFPGWENLGSFIRHLTFVKNHHRKIRKVAICADGKFPEILQQVAKHFVEAKVQHFEFENIEEAMNWAAETSER